MPKELRFRGIEAFIYRDGGRVILPEKTNENPCIYGSVSFLPGPKQARILCRNGCNPCLKKEILQMTACMQLAFPRRNKVDQRGNPIETLNKIQEYVEGYRNGS